MSLTFKELNNYACNDKETVEFSMNGIKVVLSIKDQQMSIDLEQINLLHN
jgi:hypothetical protein